MIRSKIYDDKLERLIQKYHVYVPENQLKGFHRTKRTIFKVLYELFEKENGKNVLYIFTDETMNGTKNFIRIPSEVEYRIINTISQLGEVKEISGIKDVIILTGQRMAFDYECELYNLDVKANIINIYDYFYDKSNIVVVHDFWKYKFSINSHNFIRHMFCLLKHFYCRYSSVRFVIRDLFGYQAFEEDEIMDLCRIFCIKKKYEAEGNNEKRIFYIKILLAYCLKNRDLKTALEYLDILEKDFSSYEYSDLKEELEDMLSEMSEKIRSRETEDIIINWIDAVSYQNIGDLPYVNETAKNGMYFSNAYTMMAWTTWTAKVMFSGENIIEGRLWEQSRITEKNSKLIDKLKKEGYTFLYAGSEEIRKKLYAEDFWLTTEQGTFVPSTRYIWDTLDCLASDPAKKCILIHELLETHPPIFSVKSEKFTASFSEIHEEQRKGGRLYIDEQIKWMDGFLGNNVTEVYMSDHGDHTFTTSRFCTENTNIIMVIKSERIERKEYKKFFSIVNFSYLLGCVMGWWPLDENRLLSDEVLMEFLDAYSPAYVDPFLTLEKVADIQSWMQFRAVRTSEDLLVMYANGEKAYFRLPDDEHEVSDPQYKGRIDYLTAKADGNFVDVDKEDFFANSRKLYQKLKEYGDHAE